MEPPETCDDGNRVSGDGCSEFCTGERITWCCIWPGEDDSEIVRVHRMIITRPTQQSILQKIGLVSEDVQKCPGGKLIIKTGWTDSGALLFCRHGWESGKGSGIQGSAVSVQGKVPEEGGGVSAVSAPISGEAPACVSSLLEKITGGVQSILSMMSFGLVSPPSSSPCEP